MTSRRRQSWIAGAIITIAGPPIGSIFYYFTSNLESLSSFDAFAANIVDLYTEWPILVVFSYALAGVPALVISVLAGFRICKTGWISWPDMFVLTTLMPVLGAAFMMALGVGGEVGLLSLVRLAADLAIPTALTALTLRWLIVGFGILRKPDQVRQRLPATPRP